MYGYSPGKKSSIANWAKVKIAKNICVVVDAIHGRNCIFGDFNPKNIGVKSDTRFVSFLDTDTYHVTPPQREPYRCIVGFSGYIAPELLKAIRKHVNGHSGDKEPLANMSLPTFTRDTDNFALAIHIFRLLMNGFHPYLTGTRSSSGRKSTAVIDFNDPANAAVLDDLYCFKPSNQFREKAAVLPLSAFPQEIENLFTRAFIEGRKNPSRRPSAQEWLGALERYEKEGGQKKLVQCRDNSLHQYHSKNDTCPYCEVERRTGSPSRSQDSTSANLLYIPHSPHSPRPTYPPSPQISSNTIFSRIRASWEEIERIIPKPLLIAIVGVFVGMFLLFKFGDKLVEKYMLYKPSEATVPIEPQGRLSSGGMRSGGMTGFSQREGGSGMGSGGMG
jgi:DNA-binding helix-hairpin-helix protein with protein kinase domain